MLVLTRRLGEGFRIGEAIHVVVIRDGENIRLGIEAPRELLVLRDELVAFRAEGEVAATVDHETH